MTTKSVVYPRIIIAAAGSGSGKTSITLGIIRSFLAQGKAVASFKIGPDYIDTGFHHLCTGKPCFNLDTVLMGKKGVLQSIKKHSSHSDMAIIEGVMGLYDGKNIEGAGSTAEMAILTQTPVLVVLNAKAMAQTAGALALGIKEYNTQCPVAGFILNHLGSENHYQMIKEAVEKATSLPVVGWLPKIEGPLFPERHLGLVAAWEHQNPASPDHPVHIAEKIKQQMEGRFDLKKIEEIARNAGNLPSYRTNQAIPEIMKKAPKISIALAMDDAFHFYYQENLDLLKDYGVQWVPFSLLKDSSLPPDIAGIYLGGGYPENHAVRLEQNTEMKAAIRKAANASMPIWAECGGLMYLAARLIVDQQSYAMAGVFDISVRMEKKLTALGYYQATLQKNSILGPTGLKVQGHMFRWSQVIEEPKNPSYLFKMSKSKTDFFEGYSYNNTVATYLHLHFAGATECAVNFVHSCRNFSKEKTSEALNQNSRLSR